ncbi:MAG: UDP-N-acetylmuramate--L-alanine ligase [Chloroflexi bacterium]|nr:UDP-N-acetylmuramate--L-alanine ligase [Chloroflexota bacterium]
MPDAELVVRTARRPHLVGIGGAGMSSLATLLHDLGKTVSGSDTTIGPVVRRLRERGITVAEGHDAANVGSADLVVTSAAVAGDNPEIRAARERAIPLLTHAEALGSLMAARRGMAVAGTHGKSTTTALIAHLLMAAGRDPTLVGGADVLDSGASARLGHGPELVAEADEYARRFHSLHPNVAVITGIEADHLDYFSSLAEIVEAFRVFVDGMAVDGAVITCEDEPHLADLALPRRRLRYGWAGHADWRLERYHPCAGGGFNASIRRPDGRREEFRCSLTGRHNALNAVAALAAASQVIGDSGTRLDVAREALATFPGTRRRFETRARAHGVWIVDDYAHHPTAIAATLAAAREAHDGRVVAVFQPHTTNRTAALLDDFARAFGASDRVLVTPIYEPVGRETAPAPVTSHDLIRRLTGAPAEEAPSLDAAFEQLYEELRPGTLVITLGAGDITRLAERLAEQLTRGRCDEAGQASVPAASARQMRIT